MQDILTWGGFLTGVIGLVVGISGIIFGVWAYKRPAKTQLLWDVKTDPIGVPKDPKVEVRYDGQPLDAPVLVNISLRHSIGPEMARFDNGALRFEPVEGSEGVIKGLLADGGADVELDGSALSVKPRIFQTKDQLEFMAIADGMLNLKAVVQIANVEALSKKDFDRRDRRSFYWAFAIAFGVLAIVLPTLGAFESGDILVFFFVFAIVVLTGVLLAGVTVVASLVFNGIRIVLDKRPTSRARPA